MEASIKIMLDGPTEARLTAEAQDGWRVSASLEARGCGLELAADCDFSGAQACYEKGLELLGDVATEDVGVEINYTLALQLALDLHTDLEAGEEFAGRIASTKDLLEDLFAKASAMQSPYLVEIAHIIWAARMSRGDLEDALQALGVVQSLSNCRLESEYGLLELEYARRMPTPA